MGRFKKFMAHFDDQLLVDGNEKLGSDIVEFTKLVAMCKAKDSTDFSDDSIEELATTKAHLISKQSTFHKPLTLFPGGDRSGRGIRSRDPAAQPRQDPHSNRGCD